MPNMHLTGEPIPCSSAQDLKFRTGSQVVLLNVVNAGQHNAVADTRNALHQILPEIQHQGNVGLQQKLLREKKRDAHMFARHTAPPPERGGTHCARKRPGRVASPLSSPPEDVDIRALASTESRTRRSGFQPFENLRSRRATGCVDSGGKGVLAHSGTTQHINRP